MTSYNRLINKGTRNQIKSQHHNSLISALYLALFPISFYGIYYEQTLATVANVLIIIFSYFFIIAKKELAPVLILMMYSRCMNGFVIPGDQVALKIVTGLTAYLPLFVYGFVWRNRLLARPSNIILRQNIYTFLYTGWLFLYSFFDISLSSQLFFPRLMPMIMLLFAVLVIDFGSEWRMVRDFLRYISISCLLIFFLSDYSTISYELLTSGAVFGIPANDAIYTAFGLPLNFGIFWDQRILGLFSTIFLLMAIASEPYRFKYLDIALAVTAISTTLSRGSVVLSLLCVFGLLLQYRKIKVILMLISIGLIGSLIFAMITINTDALSSFMATLNPFSEEINAISQRGSFRDYALNSFYKNPLGGGVGHLKGSGINRTIEFTGVIYEKASDAFLFIQLAEIGIIGFFLFSASLIEIIYNKTIVSVFLIIGLFILMIGTDVPDMGWFYLCFLLLSINVMNRFKFRYITNLTEVSRFFKRSNQGTREHHGKDDKIFS